MQKKRHYLGIFPKMGGGSTQFPKLRGGIKKLFFYFWSKGGGGLGQSKKSLSEKPQVFLRLLLKSPLLQQRLALLACLAYFEVFPT